MNILWLLAFLAIFFGIIVPVTAELGYRFIKWMDKRGRW